MNSQNWMHVSQTSASHIGEERCTSVKHTMTVEVWKKSMARSATRRRDQVAGPLNMLCASFTAESWSTIRVLICRVSLTSRFYEYVIAKADKLKHSLAIRVHTYGYNYKMDNKQHTLYIIQCTHVRVYSNNLSTRRQS